MAEMGQKEDVEDNGRDSCVPTSMELDGRTEKNKEMNVEHVDQVTDDIGVSILPKMDGKKKAKTKNQVKRTSIIKPQIKTITHSFPKTTNHKQKSRYDRWGLLEEGRYPANDKPDKALLSLSDLIHRHYLIGGTKKDLVKFPGLETCFTKRGNLRVDTQLARYRCHAERLGLSDAFYAAHDLEGTTKDQVERLRDLINKSRGINKRNWSLQRPIHGKDSKFITHQDIQKDLDTLRPDKFDPNRNFSKNKLAHTMALFNAIQDKVNPLDWGLERFGSNFKKAFDVVTTEIRERAQYAYQIETCRQAAVKEIHDLEATVKRVMHLMKLKNKKRDALINFIYEYLPNGIEVPDTFFENEIYGVESDHETPVHAAQHNVEGRAIPWVESHVNNNLWDYSEEYPGDLDYSYIPGQDDKLRDELTTPGWAPEPAEVFGLIRALELEQSPDTTFLYRGVSLDETSSQFRTKKEYIIQNWNSVGDLTADSSSDVETKEAAMVLITAWVQAEDELQQIPSTCSGPGRPLWPPKCYQSMDRERGGDTLS